ncbi:hypothetical protein V6R21_31340 [Limibacter armeniacum]|uniref:hypothetical protein n=1 Tax=Limibacter armeniacum TaxID=466084 RepID=UPI002FE67FD5
MKQYKISFLLILLFAMLGSCKSQQEQTVVPDYFYQTWVHSLEEDNDSVVVMRNEQFDFPVIRGGRSALTFEKDGTVKKREMAPNDGHYLITEGKWSYIPKNYLLKVELEDGREEEYTVVVMKEEIMKLKEVAN